MWESIILIVPQLLSVVVGRCSSVLGISGYCYVMNFNSQVFHWWGGGGGGGVTVFEEITADVLLIRTIPTDIFTPLPSSLMLCKLQNIHSPKSWKAILSHCCSCNTTTSTNLEKLKSVAVIMFIFESS